MRLNSHVRISSDFVDRETKIPQKFINTVLLKACAHLLFFMLIKIHSSKYMRTCNFQIKICTFLDMNFVLIFCCSLVVHV